MKFSVLHVKNHQGLIEPSVDHSRSHIKWNVSSLSPVGPVVQTSKPTEHHGVVQIYKEVGQQDSYSFRVYLATNNDSDITVRKQKTCTFTKVTQNSRNVLERMYGNILVKVVSLS